MEVDFKINSDLEAKKLTAVFHFDEEDTKCYSDYCGIELFDGKNRIATFEDDYHDSGQEKLEAFIAGMQFSTKQLIILNSESIPDGKIF